MWWHLPCNKVHLARAPCTPELYHSANLFVSLKYLHQLQQYKEYLSLPMKSHNIWSRCDFTSSVYKLTHIPFGVDLNECNLGLGNAFKGTDPEMPFWQAGFEGHSPFLMTGALVAAKQNHEEFALGIYSLGKMKSYDKSVLPETKERDLERCLSFWSQWKFFLEKQKT